MATAYGSAVSWNGYSAFRARMDYSISSNTDTTAVVTVVSKVEMTTGNDAGSNFSATSTISGTTKTASGSGYYSAGNTYTIISSQTKTITKTTASQSVSVSVKVSDSYMGGSSTASATLTVGAKTSYAVTYNANGGTGAPAAQTKWYGDTQFTLSTTKPTRTNYTFLGWSTSSTATTATYAAGASYTANATLTLYAVWELAYVAPTITSLTAYRSDSSGTADPESTTYLTFVASWSFDQTGYTTASPNDSGSIVFAYGTTSTTVAISGSTSGSTTKVVSGTFAASSSYSVTATLTDESGLTASKTAVARAAFKPFHMANKGHSAAFFGFASAALTNILTVFGSVVASDGHFYAKSSSTDTSASSLSAQTDRGFFVRDKNDRYLAYFLGRQTTAARDDAIMLARRYNSSANVDNALRLSVTAAGVREVAVSDKKVWFTAIGAWTSIATTTGTTAKTFSLTGYSEICVVGKYGTTYAGSVVIPVAALTTTATEWYLGGGARSATGNRRAVVKLTTTNITPVCITVDGTDYTSSTCAWTVYAR